MADSGHETCNVTEELKKQREALENNKSDIKKIYNQNKIINLAIKHSFKNKIRHFVKNISIYVKHDPAKEGANNVRQLIDLEHELGKVEGAIDQINSTIMLIKNNDKKANKEGRILNPRWHSEEGSPGQY